MTQSYRVPRVIPMGDAEQQRELLLVAKSIDKTLAELADSAAAASGGNP
jgi:hypothetical protein